MDLGLLLTGRIKSLLYKIVKWLIILFFSSSILAVILFKFVPVYYTPLMGIRCYQQHKAGKELHCEKDWTPIDDVSPNMYRAAMAAEDGSFMTHHGFDWDAIGDAMENNLNGGKKKGGSTISQQTAKNVFLWPGRSWLRKGLESYFTVLIEFCWSKERIMEVYLNIVETGDGIYGVEATAQKFYKKSAKTLTKKEAATIAASLRSPLKSDIGHPDKKMIAYRKGIMRNMKYVQNITFGD